jgi:hypothetical protein
MQLKFIINIHKILMLLSKIEFEEKKTKVENKQVLLRLIILISSFYNFFMSKKY